MATAKDAYRTAMREDILGATHGDVFANNFGVDLDSLDIDELVRSQMGAQLGTDVSGSLSFRELTEIQQKRMNAVRGTS